MSTEARRVPANWEHPKDENGHHIPMHEHFPYDEEEIVEGLRDGWLNNDPPNYGCDVMPQWPESERTHYQMYESVTEGTPISPVMETPEALARWLADNKASAGPYATATYDQWLAMIKAGSSVGSFVMDCATGRTMSGVEAVSRLK
ncbi:hypothetical protein KKA15_05035 [Patescibacteria group bacterium]|nr:hypothetical protein [Patescibacteria group bacterium]